MPAVVAAVIALIGVIISATIAFAASRRSAYLASVTSERSKWIDELRSNVAELAGLCAYIHYKNRTSTDFSKTPERDALLLKVENLTALITLQLNPHAEIDKNIIEVLERIAFLAERRDFLVFSAHWLLIHHAQWLLKEEWETVKYEAAGRLRRWWIAAKRWKRTRQYREFCSNDGSLADLRSDRDKDTAGAEGT